MQNLRNNQSSLDLPEDYPVDESLSRNLNGTTESTGSIPDIDSNYGSYDDLD